MNNNPFQALSDQLPPESTAIVTNTANQSEPHSDTLDSFLANIKNENMKSLAELSESIETTFSIKAESANDYRHNFEKFDGSHEQQYEEEMTKRLNCFEDKEDPTFVSHIKGRIASFDTIELRPLLDTTISKLNLPEPKGHGGLFLMGLIVAQRPDLITPKLFNFPHDFLLLNAPIICWIIGHATSSLTIAHLDPLLSHQIIDIFINELNNPEKTSNSVAVCAAHLIARAFARQNVMRASAYHYATLLSLYKSNGSTRTKHIASVLKPLIGKLTVVDMKDLAPQMMTIFPNAPNFALNIFIREVSKKDGGNASFVDGWIEAHANHKKASMSYLTQILGSLPEYVINKFPMQDLIEGGDLAKLAAMKFQLTNSSFRFIFILAIMAILYQVWIKKKVD